MLEFKPFDIDDKLHGYCAEENGTQIGKCVFCVGGLYVDVLSVEAVDSLTAEGLVRSALNFAANRSAYMARADIKKVSAEPFKTLGFEEENGFYVSDIPSALTGSCSHCGK